MPGFVPGRPAHGSLAWAAEQFARLLDLEKQRNSGNSRARKVARGRLEKRWRAGETDFEAQNPESRFGPLDEPMADFDTPGQEPKAPQRPLDGGAPRGNVNQGSRMEHLRMLMKIPRLSPASLDAAREMAANLELSKDTVNALSDPTRNIDKKRQQDFIESVSRDRALVDAITDWTDRPADGSISRQEAARRIVEHHARVHGYPLPPVVFEDLADNRGGEYRPHTNTIAIDPTHGFAAQPASGFGTPAHEGTHAYATQLMRDLAEGRISIGDPRYPLLQMLRYSRRFYTEPEDNQNRYRRQPWESYARAVEAPLAELVQAIGSKKKHDQRQP